ncbi:MAG: hypothetical protein J0M12_00975 [Deltaproteobacteria bacterium]|nr:hypothetical protein [Deltaproteobacteria bacterium]
MGLTRYRKKRDFSTTSEPRAIPARSGGKLRFVVQKHAASRLHYDFRLEYAGVLKSWAIPKGPSLNPQEKRLAIQVEDHPLAYADFEGIIPQGQYGGGSVLVWDQGTWECSNIQKGLSEGKLEFALHGEKLKGRWSLVRMRGDRRDGKNWLLMKVRDRYASATANILSSSPLSVLSGRGLDEVSAEEISKAELRQPNTTKRSGKQGT